MIARYSQIYVEKPSNLSDSPKLRKRISSYYHSYIHYEKIHCRQSEKIYDVIIANLIEQEVGIGIEKTYNGFSVTYHTVKLLLNCSINDFLDCISVIDSVLTDTTKKDWIEFVERVFREENMPYTLGSDGVVHLYVDEEFSNSYEATISLLSLDRYEHTKVIYENSYNHLRSDKQNTRSAIKDMFESIETLSKLMDNKIKRLGAKEVNNNLKPICDRVISDEDEKDFINLMISGLAEWVNAHHKYRHGQGKEEHTPPSLDSAILSLSVGSAYLRFLMQIDQKTTENNLSS